MAQVFALLVATLLFTGCKSTSNAPLPDANAPADTNTPVDAAPGADMAIGVPLADAASDLAAAPADTGAGAVDGGNVPPVAGECERSLSGTWDLIAARPGRTPDRGVMTISATTLILEVLGNQLGYRVTGADREAVWKRNGGNEVFFKVQNKAEPFDSGSLPLALGGSWAFAAGGQQCGLNVAGGLINARCLAEPGATYVGGPDWPFAIPQPINGRVYAMVRTMRLPSQFGELGGRWMATSETPGETCTLTIEGNKLAADCVTDNVFNGRTQLVIGANCIASGSTSSGHELSARRR